MAISDFAVEINKLVSGACAIAYTPTTTPAPVNIGDIITLNLAPAPVSPWLLFGATKGGASYSDDVKSSELTIDQRTAAIFEDIDTVTRTMKFDSVQISPEVWKFTEQSAAITTIPAVVGAATPANSRSAQKLVKSGAFSQYDSYRFALIGQRRKSQGIVTQPDGQTRGCYVVIGFYLATLAPSSSETKFEQGALAARSVELKAFPDSTLTPGADTGFFFEEQAGVMT